MVEPSPSAPAPAEERDIRPSVVSNRRPVPNWVYVAALAVLGIALFLVLDSRRRALQAPAVKVAAVDLSGGAPLPTLYVPPVYTAPAFAYPSPPTPQPSAALPSPTPPAPAPVQAQPAPMALPYSQQPSMEPTPAPRPASATPAVVIDRGRAEGMAAADSPARPDDQQANREGGTTRKLSTERARAGSFANPKTTVVQGTLVPVILESAIDSTHAGFVRAIVSRDVRGFDGSRILIPRGSRLIGEYDAQAAPGQKRAFINWTRLIRPDGATVAIESPAADSMGRTGLKASVNSHFFERFGGAILQSILDIGVNAASRAVDSPTVIALPGSFPAVPERIQSQQITPTLSVRRGTSISVFVARDLDFSGVERARR